MTQYTSGSSGRSRSRRSFLAGAAGAAGTMGLLSGCLSGAAAPLGPLTVTGTAAQVTSRRTNVIATVENSSDQRASAMLWAQLSLDDTSYEQNRQITVPPMTEEAFTFEFDVTPTQFDYTAWIE